MAGYYNAESLLRGTPVPQMDISSVVNAGKFANDAFNQFRQNEIAVATNKLKRDQLAQQKELAMLPYDMQEQATNRANQLITMSQNEIANSNPNADKFFNELYANVQNEQDLANANQKLFTALGGQKDSTGYVNLDPTKLNQFNVLVEGTDQEKAIRTRDAIIRNALVQGVDPITANTLATNEYNRLYGTQAATNQELIKEELKSLDDRLKYALEYGVGKPKSDGNSVNLNFNGNGITGGIGSVNSSTVSGARQNDPVYLKEQINEIFKPGNSLTSFGDTTDEVMNLALDIQSSDVGRNKVSDQQVIKLLERIKEGKADAWFSFDASIPDNLKKPENLNELAKAALLFSDTTNFSDSTKGKAGQLDVDAQSQLLADRMNTVNEIMNQTDKTRQAYFNQLNPTSSYTQLSNFVNKAQRQTGMNAAISNIDYSQDLNNINTDRFAQIVSNIESKGDYGAENYKSDGTINAAGKYQFVQSTLNQTLKNMGLPSMTLKEFQKNPQLQEAAFKQLTNDNAKFLKANNLGVNPFNLWMVHNLGANQTKNFADINSPLSDETKSAIWANLPAENRKGKTKDTVTRENYVAVYGKIFNADINQFTQPTSTGNEQVNQNTSASTSERIQQLFANVQDTTSTQQNPIVSTNVNNSNNSNNYTNLQSINDINSKLQYLQDQGSKLPSNSTELNNINSQANALIKERENIIRGQQLAASINPSGNTSLMSENSKQLADTFITKPLVTTLKSLGYTTQMATNVLADLSKKAGLLGISLSDAVAQFIKEQSQSKQFVNGVSVVPNRPAGYVQQ